MSNSMFAMVVVTFLSLSLAVVMTLEVLEKSEENRILNNTLSTYEGSEQSLVNQGWSEKRAKEYVQFQCYDRNTGVLKW